MEMRTDCIYMAQRPAEADLRAIQAGWDRLCTWLIWRGYVGLTRPVETVAVPKVIHGENVGNICDAWSSYRDKAYRVFLVRSIGGFAGAFVHDNNAILGDWCIDALREIPADWGDAETTSRDGQLGAMLHELGHLWDGEDGEPGFMSHYKTWPDVQIPPKLQGRMFRDRPWWARLWAWLGWRFG